MIASMVIPFQVIMIPLVSIYGGQLHLLNHRLTLILMHVGFSTAMSVFMYHGFIKSVPRSVEEAAVIDGCNILQLFFRVVFPLLKSTTVTVIILKCNVDLERLSAAFFSHRQFRFQNPDPGNLLCQNAFRAIWKSLGINFSRSLSFHHSYHHRLFISAKNTLSRAYPTAQ